MTELRKEILRVSLERARFYLESHRQDRDRAEAEIKRNLEQIAKICRELQE